MKNKIEAIMSDPQKRNVVVGVIAITLLALLASVIFKEPQLPSQIIRQKAKVDHELFAADEIAELDKDRINTVLNTFRDELVDREKSVTKKENEVQREMDRMNNEVLSMQEKLLNLSAENSSLVQQMRSKSDRPVVIGNKSRRSKGQSMFKNFNNQGDGSQASYDPAYVLAKDAQQRLLPIASDGNVNTTGPALSIRKIRGQEVSFKTTGGDPEKEKLKVAETKRIAQLSQETEEEDDSVFLPAGSILSGTLLTGLDAPTGGNARNDPWPTVLRVKHEAILPNRWSLDIRECFIIAAAYGDLSSERAMMRAETLSCIRSDGKAIEVSLDAYGSGSDGKAGVRGRVVTKNGQLLAQSLFAGFFGGLAEASTPQAIPTIETSNSGNTAYKSAQFADIMESSALSGASSAADRIADYLLKVAEGIFPVIEIDAGRKVDFVVKRGIVLKLK